LQELTAASSARARGSNKDPRGKGLHTAKAVAKAGAAGDDSW